MNGFPRPFVLRRAEDVSGVSGTGDVAEGVEFTDGTVALRWRSETASTVLWDRLDDAEAVHGHDGRTAVVFADEAADAVLLQARRTAGGLQVRLAELRREVHKAEEELGRLRPALAEAQERIRELSAPCMVEPPETAFEHSQPLGPCLVLGAHQVHRDASGATWRELTEDELARHRAWVEMVQLGQELDPPAA